MLTLGITSCGKLEETLAACEISSSCGDDNSSSESSETVLDDKLLRGEEGVDIEGDMLVAVGGV